MSAGRNMNVFDRIAHIARSLAAEAKVLPPEGRRRSWKIIYPDGKIHYSPTKPSEEEVVGKPPAEKPEKKPEVEVSKKDIGDIRRILKKELGELPEGVDDIIQEEVGNVRNLMKEPESVFSEKEMALPEKSEQPVKTEKELFAQAKKAQDSMMKMLDRGQGLDKAMGAKHFDTAKGQSPDLDTEGPIIITAPLKGKERSREKVESDYGGDWSKLKDVVRASVGVDTFEQVGEAIKKLRDMGMEIAEKPVDRFANPTSAGYRDIKINVRYPSGHIGELQVHLKSILKAKEQAHKDYEVVRSIEAKAKKAGRKDLTKDEQRIVDGANEKMKKAYEDAWSAATQQPVAKAASLRTAAPKVRYYELEGNPVILEYRKFPVMTVKGKDKVYYDFFKLFHEGREISKAEYEKRKKKG